MLRRRRIATTFVGLVFHVVILPGRIGLTPEVQAIFQQLQRQLQLQLLVQRPACTKQVGCLLVFSLCHSDCLDLDLDLELELDLEILLTYISVTNNELWRILPVYMG